MISSRLVFCVTIVEGSFIQGISIMARSRDYQDFLIQVLRDPEEANAYLNAILEECKSCDAEEAQKLLSLALKNIAQIQQVISQ
jgi:DNA-binding phage protein